MPTGLGLISDVLSKEFLTVLGWSFWLNFSSKCAPAAFPDAYFCRLGLNQHPSRHGNNYLIVIWIYDCQYNKRTLAAYSEKNLNWFN